MDRDASGAGLSLPECADGAGSAWQPKQYVLTDKTFFGTMADLLVVPLTTVADSAARITFLLSPISCPLVIAPPRVCNFNQCIFSGMLSTEVQEDVREAANNLVKHFHKPEQEVITLQNTSTSLNKR